MKVVILAGGYGTRISEETGVRPKPMVEIGGKPILWHIMKYYSSFGHNEFVILLGYMGETIREYFSTIQNESWKVTMLDTGLETMTGGRVKRAEEYLKDSTFMLTYGDGVSDVDLHALEAFHHKNNTLMTLTTVQPPSRFGVLDLEGDYVRSFAEKPKGDGSWINAGFFICEPGIFDYLKDGDATVLERAPLENLARDKQLVAFKHEKFWHPMDTLRDKKILEDLWRDNRAPWKVW